MKYMLFLMMMMMMMMIMTMTTRPVTAIVGSYEMYFRDCVVTSAQDQRRKQKKLRMLDHQMNAPK